MINRLHAGKYWCNLPLTSLSIDVLYSPILNPVCISSSTHNTFFLKVPPEPFNFSCLSEEGNPPINMTLLLLSDKGNIKSLMTSSRHDVIRDSQSVSLTYSSALDASFDNVSLIDQYLLRFTVCCDLLHPLFFENLMKWINKFQNLYHYRLFLQNSLSLRNHNQRCIEFVTIKVKYLSLIYRDEI